MAQVPANVTVPFSTIDMVEAYPEGRFTSQITFRCLWAARHTLARQLVGRTTTGTFPALTYVMPAVHPANDYAFVKDIASITGFPRSKPDADGSGAASQSYPDYTYADLVVNYELPPWGDSGPGGNEFTEEGIEGTSEFLTLPSDNLIWDADPKVALDKMAAPSIKMNSLVFNWRISNINVLPQAVITLIGCVNDSVLQFRTLGMVVQPETLLYSPPSLKRYIYANGAGAWDASFRFPYRPTGWNKFFRSGSVIPEAIAKRVGATTVPFKPYTPASFTQLRLSTP